MIPEARNDYEAAAQAAGFEIADHLTNAVNKHYKHQVACGLANGFLRTHRTLQQSAISTLAEALVAYAVESKDFTDMRNEHVVRAITKHREALLEIARAPFV
jgi:hypothetical protein